MSKKLPIKMEVIVMLGVAAFISFLGIAAETETLFDSVFPEFTTKNVDYTEETERLKQLESPPVYSSQKYTNDDKQSIITYNNISDIKSFDIIRKTLYNIDGAAYVFDDDLDFDKLLSIDTKVDIYGNEPKILIFHTHSQEAFADSAKGDENESIIGVGAHLAKILSEKYGASVLHHKGVYDMVDGKPARGGSYEVMEKDIRQVLEKYPSIEVILDLHRDSLPNNKRLLTEISGKATAQIMFFNGICRLNENGSPVPTGGLENEFIEENLALSLRAKLLANELFPDFTRKNYIKPYRYSLHMRPNSMLIEVGSDTNTVSEAKNAMEPLAEILIKAFN